MRGTTLCYCMPGEMWGHQSATSPPKTCRRRIFDDATDGSPQRYSVM